MKFLDSQHKNKFNTLIEKDNTHQDDSERQALFYIISGNKELFEKHNLLYDFQNSYANTDCFEKGIDLTSTSKSLLRLGFNLYNSYGDKYTTPIDILCNLNKQNYDLAIQSMNIRFDNVQENVLEDEWELEV
jgi:hypothetical protein